MEEVNHISKLRTEESHEQFRQTKGEQSPWNRLLYVSYGVGLTASISPWFIAIRAPLWLDETVSYYLIKTGFWGIVPREGWPGVPAYYYILWLWTKIAGTGEIPLRISSILAMLGAVYLLYRAATELFDREVGMITAVIFSIHPIVIYSSIDVRPYAFAVLSVCACIYILVRLRNSGSLRLAGLFGLLAAFVVCFHMLYGAILPALALGFFVIKAGDRQNLWKQTGAALAAFLLAFSLAIPGLLYLFRTSETHVWDQAPPLSEFWWTAAPTLLPFVLGGTVLVAAFMRKIDLTSKVEPWRLILCVATGLIPLLILFVISVQTPLHIFTYRYRLVAIPGIALCWGWLLSRLDSRLLRILFCLALVIPTTYRYWDTPAMKRHAYSWKDAIAEAEQLAISDNAPVLMCSDLPEADHMPMPTGEAVKDSALLAPLSYYQLSVPVVALPRALNDQAMQIGSQFVMDASARHQRFLAMGFVPSYPTLKWLTYIASNGYTIRTVGVYDDVVLLEFTPINAPSSHWP